MWASQVVYQLSPAARALMAFLKLFLHHILSLRATSHTLTTRRLCRPTDWSSRARLLLLVIALASLLRGLLVHLLELFLVRKRVRTELLSLFTWSLLVGTHLLLSLLEFARVTICPLHALVILTSLLSRHVEDRCGLAWVVNNDVVDVIIVDDVRHVTTRVLSLNALLRVARRWSATSHS